MFVSRVQTSAVIVTNSSSFQNQNLTFVVGLFSCICTPQTYSDTKITFICDNDILSIFNHASLFDIHLGKLSDLSDTTDCVDCSHLFKFVDFFYCVETKALRHNSLIVRNMLNSRVLIKYNTVIIFDAGVLLICHFYLTVCKSVNLVFYKRVVMIISLIVEKCCLDLSTYIINQLNIQQTPTATLIFPRFFLMFFSHTRFYFPVKKKCIQ